MSIDFNGPLCSCGRRGCLEAYASQPLLLDRRRPPSVAPSPVRIWRRHGLPPPAGPSLRMWPTKLSIALVNTVNLLDPQCILIGHEGARFPAACIARIEEKVNSGILARGLQIHRGRALPFRAGRSSCRAAPAVSGRKFSPAIFRCSINSPCLPDICPGFFYPNRPTGRRMSSRGTLSQEKSATSSAAKPAQEPRPARRHRPAAPPHPAASARVHTARRARDRRPAWRAAARRARAEEAGAYKRAVPLPAGGRDKSAAGWRPADPAPAPPGSPPWRCRPPPPQAGKQTPRPPAGQ